VDKAESGTAGYCIYSCAPEKFHFEYSILAVVHFATLT
jgi:hypothetical protein